LAAGVVRARRRPAAPRFRPLGQHLAEDEAAA
jgi:hypothetical protein